VFGAAKRAVFIALKNLRPQLHGHAFPGHELLVEIRIKIVNAVRPFLRALWLVCATKVYSGLGADIVMESL